MEVKKFQFKPAGHISVSNVIKKVGIFNDDDEEGKDKAAVVAKATPA